MDYAYTGDLPFDIMYINVNYIKLLLFVLPQSYQLILCNLSINLKIHIFDI